MFTNFTWWQFFGAFLLFSVLYYPLILWYYFREEVKHLFQPAFVENLTPENILPEQSVEEVSVVPTVVESIQGDTIAAAISNLQKDIIHGVKAAKDAGVNKDQLMGLFKNILLKYPELKSATHQVQINDFLIQESAKANYVLQQFEAYALWPISAESNG